MHRRLPIVARLGSWRVQAMRTRRPRSAASLVGAASTSTSSPTICSSSAPKRVRSTVGAFLHPFLVQPLARLCGPVVAGCFSHEHEAPRESTLVAFGARALRCAGGAFSLPAYSDSGRAFTRR